MFFFPSSQVSLLIEDTEFLPGRMNGSLRRFLMKEHLGRLGDVDGDQSVMDPVSDAFYKDVWLRTAATNAKVFHPFMFYFLLFLVTSTN